METETEVLGWIVYDAQVTAPDSTAVAPAIFKECLTSRLRVTTARLAPVAFRWEEHFDVKVQRWFNGMLLEMVLTGDMLDEPLTLELLLDRTAALNGRPSLVCAEGVHIRKAADARERHGYPGQVISSSRDLAYQGLMSLSERYVVIDGVIWRRCDEPRYRISPTGGGWAGNVAIVTYYDPYLPWQLYVPANNPGALRRAVSKAIASGSAAEEMRHSLPDIEVLIPEAVKLNPESDYVELMKVVRENARRLGMASPLYGQPASDVV